MRSAGGFPSVKIGLGVLLVGGVMLWETWRMGGRVMDLLIILAAAACHELGHLAAAKLCGVHVRGMCLDLFGARLQLDGLPSYGAEWLIAAAGPLVNLLSAAACLWGWQIAGGDASADIVLFSLASLALGGINLLPIGSLDGGRMLYCTAAYLGGDAVAARILRGSSLVCLSILWLTAGYVLLRAGGMLTVYIFSLGLLLRLSPWET